MRDSGFKLRDKTVLILGPVQGIVQSMASLLTELGADVAMVDKNVKEAQRYATALMDAREVREDHGRAATVEADITNTRQAKDAVSRVAEMFGSIDVFIDARFNQTPRPFINTEDPNSFDLSFEENLKGTLLVTHEVLQFLVGRSKGRVIYLTNGPMALSLKGEAIHSATRSGLGDLARSLAREVGEKNVTINCLRLGLTEEFLLSRFPEAPSIEAAKQQLQTQLPQAKLVEPMEVAQVVAFLASPLSSAITGQTINIDHGW